MKCIINRTLYWLLVMLVPILFTVITVIFMDPFFQWKTGIMIIVIFCLVWRCYVYEKYRHENVINNYYIVPLDPIDEEINNQTEDFFCRHKTKKVWINERVKSK